MIIHLVTSRSIRSYRRAVGKPSTVLGVKFDPTHLKNRDSSAQMLKSPFEERAGARIHATPFVGLSRPRSWSHYPFLGGVVLLAGAGDSGNLSKVILARETH